MLIPFEELKQEMKRVLIKNGMNEEKAELCAGILAGNSRDGVYSHGLNRFPQLIQTINDGLINVNAEPALVSTKGAFETWNGNLAPGVYTATKAVAKAADLAKQNGVGAVAVRNTNHWMRGGTYGWQAADKGCVAICATNAIANMPPWGGKDARLGNNPLVIAVPRKQGHLVLDMAMSQYSYGKMHEHQLASKQLEHPGGYDADGKLTTDPVVIMKSKRTLPVGLWKGSGLALMIDVLVSALSGGKTVAGITGSGKEYGVSQFFLCIAPDNLDKTIIEEIISYAKSSGLTEDGGSIRYPGESTLARRRKSENEGVYVNEKIWAEVTGL